MHLFLHRVADLRNRPLLIVLDPQVNDETSFRVVKALGERHFEALDVMLVGPGGSIDAAYLIGRLLREHANTTTALVPLDAKSALTLVALACSEVAFAQLGQLGPLDVQYFEHDTDDRGHVKHEHRAALNVFAGVEAVQARQRAAFDEWLRNFKQGDASLEARVEWATNWVAQVTRPLVEKIDVEELGKFSRDNRVAEDYLRALMPRLEEADGRPVDPDAAAQQERLRSQLTSGFSSHSFVIDYDLLHSLGHPVRHVDEAMERLLLETGYELLSEGLRRPRFLVGLFFPSTSREGHAHDPETGKVVE